MSEMKLSNFHQKRSKFDRNELIKFFLRCKFNDRINIENSNSNSSYEDRGNTHYDRSIWYHQKRKGKLDQKRLRSYEYQITSKGIIGTKILHRVLST